LWNKLSHGDLGVKQSDYLYAVIVLYETFGTQSTFDLYKLQLPDDASL